MASSPQDIAPRIPALPAGLPAAASGSSHRRKPHRVHRHCHRCRHARLLRTPASAPCHRTPEASLRHRPAAPPELQRPDRTAHRAPTNCRAIITGSRCRRIGARLKWNLFESRQLFHLTRAPNGGDRHLSASIQKSKPSAFAFEIRADPSARRSSMLRNPPPSPGERANSALSQRQTRRHRSLYRDRSPTKAGGEADPAGWVTAVVCLGKQRSAAARLRRRLAG